MLDKRYQRLKQVLDRRQSSLTLLLEEVHKPHNLAAVMRSADATGLHAIHAVGKREVTRRTPKSAAGSKRWVKVRMHDSTANAFQALRDEGKRIVVADPGEGSLPFTQYDFTQPTAVVFGQELEGLTDYARQQADACIHIPMLGFTESLNVSVSAALILHEAMRQREQAGMYQQCELDEVTYRKTLFEWAWPQLAYYCRIHHLSYPKFDLESGELLEDLPGSVTHPW